MNSDGNEQIEKNKGEEKTEVKDEQVVEEKAETFQIQDEKEKIDNFIYYNAKIIEPEVYVKNLLSNSFFFILLFF